MAKKNNHFPLFQLSKITYFFIFVVLIIGFLLGAQFQKYKKVSPTVDSETTMDVSSWTTYKDPIYKFQVSYPSEWTVTKDPTLVGGKYSIFWAAENPAKGSEPAYAILLRQPIAGHMKLADWLETEKGTELVPSYEASQLVFLNDDHAMIKRCEGICSYYSYINLNDTIYQVIVSAPDESENLVKAIVSTLKLDDALQASSEWLTYTHKKFPKPSGWENYPWLGFTLQYPSSWNLTEKNRNASTGDLDVSVSKADGSTFRILQGFGEGGTCLFPDDPNYHTFQGMGSQYGDYIQINKSGYQWRLAPIAEQTRKSSYALCQLHDGTYYSSNNVGIMDIKLTTKESEAEFNEMMQKLEIF
jgi:hypothetical protein